MSNDTDVQPYQNRRQHSPRKESMSTKPFAHTSVILTGASSGIGYVMALQLAEQGAFLTLGALDLPDQKGSAPGDNN